MQVNYILVLYKRFACHCRGAGGVYQLEACSPSSWTRAIEDGIRIRTSTKRATSSRRIPVRVAVIDSRSLIEKLMPSTDRVRISGYPHWLLYTLRAFSPARAPTVNLHIRSYCHLQSIGLISISSFTTAATLLAGLFCYDIFWVFGTEVMVSCVGCSDYLPCGFA